MPTLPLFDPAPATLHAIQAPGGYEVWRFAAHDPSNQIWITASFHQGFPSYQYIRRYVRYRRWPTRFKPPLPQESLGLRILIHTRDHQLSSSIQIDPAIAESMDERCIYLGPDRFFKHVARGVHICADGIDLIFAPRHQHQSLEADVTSPHSTKGETHRWIVPTGLCDVTGTIAIGQAMLRFAGTGVRDQQYGTAPLLRSSWGGQVILSNEAILFQTTDQLRVVTVDEFSLKIKTAATPRSRPLRSVWALPYPTELKLADESLLWKPKLVDSNAVRSIIIYDADWQGERGVAMCEVNASHRLGWPIVGRFIGR